MHHLDGREARSARVSDEERPLPFFCLLEEKAKVSSGPLVADHIVIGNGGVRCGRQVFRVWECGRWFGFRHWFDFLWFRREWSWFFRFRVF